MKEELLRYLPDPDTVKGGMAAIVETIQTEAPELVKEIIRWAVACHFLYLVGFVGAGYLVIYLAKKMTKADWYKESCNDTDDPSPLFLWAGLGVAGIVSAIGIGHNIIATLKPLIVPRLFLLEYITELFKGK